MSSSDQIPVDENANAGYESDEGAPSLWSSRSLASTEDRHRYEHGRRYHSFRDGSYWAPNDNLNAVHEKVWHHMMLIVMEDRLHLAPVTSPRHVIDLGTGSGLWAADFADFHEDAEVWGVDLSIVGGPIPPNLRFIVDDICSEWTYNVAFDFVHIRSLYGSIADWPFLYKQCFDNMVPGGYIEHIELNIRPKSDDDTLPPDSILHRWNNVVATDWSAATGKDFFLADKMKEQIAAAGFVDVNEKIIKMPLGPWSSDNKYKQLGRLYQQFWRTGMEGWVVAIATRILGWTAEQVSDFLKETKKFVENPVGHCYYELFVVYARKP